MEATQPGLRMRMDDWGEAREGITSFGVCSVQKVQFFLLMTTLSILCEIFLLLLAHPLLFHPIRSRSLSLL